MMDMLETMGPRRRRHFSFNESVDEPGKAMDLEPTDEQTAVPNDRSEPVEQIEDTDLPSPSAPEN